MGADVFITLFDEDENIDGTALDTTEVTVESLTTGDVETITLTETANVSEEFSNTAGLPTAVGAAVPGDGILQQNGSEDLRVTYLDDEDASDTISNNLLALPIVWDGGGVGSNWNTPENWSTDTVPTAFDSVIFDATSSKRVSINENQQAFNFTMTTGYAGTLSGSGSLTINGDMSIDGGTILWQVSQPIIIEGNLVVSGGSVRMTSGSLNLQVIGDTTITGGTVEWRRTDFTGDVLISGGSVTWERSIHVFQGDYIRTGGTVNTTSDTEFRFNPNGQQAFTIGAGGIALRSLRVSGGSSQVLDITGDITIGDARFRGSVSFNRGTTNLDGRLTVNSLNSRRGSQFVVFGGTVLNVLSGSVIDARGDDVYTNQGTINEIGTGKVLRFTTGVGLTESTGMIPVNKIDLGDPIFLLLFDEDENIRGGVLDTAQITLTNLINGDFEIVMLTERSLQSEDFFFAAGFPTAVGAAIVGNDILEASVGNIIQICYQDDEDPADRLCVFKVATVPDCNSNGVDDLVDIATGTSQDCDNNGIPDECKLPPIGDAPDCNNDLIPDICQIVNNDCNNNGTPDDCESFFDCNLNGVADACDIFDGISIDCNLNGIPDECDSPDCDGDDIPDECEPDCDNDQIPDDCEVDCNGNNIPEDCETFTDCNINGIPDECDIAEGTSADCNGNNIPDQCEIDDGSTPDCNGNGIPDGCDIDPTDPDGDGLVSADVNGNGIPDECDNEPPVCDAGGPYAAECSGTTTSIILDGGGSSDPDFGDVLTFSWSTDCLGGGFDDNTLERPTLTLGSPPPCPVTCNVSLMVDNGADTDACSATVTITDTTAPAVLCPGSVSIECDDSTDPNVNLTLGQATATDDCDGNPAIAFSDVNNLTGCNGTGTITRTWTATDACGNVSAGCAQSLTVVDTTAPVLSVDTTPITVTDVDCSGGEVVALPVGSATDSCGSVTVSDDAPSVFPAGTTTTVTFTATDGCGRTALATLDVTLLFGADIWVEAAKHTVGSGSSPGSTKEPFVGIEICAYDKSDGSCARVMCGGISHQHYECIATNCAATNCCTTDANGECNLNLPPGDYIVISTDATKTVLPDPLGVSASDLVCGELKRKHLQQIVKADGKKVPGKTTRRTGSELLIIEPEFVVWDGTEQLYPFVFETVGDWGVTANVEPPEGFVSDYDSLSADINNEIEAVQFTITEVGSDLVPTGTTFEVTHKGRREIIHSRVDIFLTAEYARGRGFNVAQLRAAGLIKERPGNQGQGNDHRP